MGSFKSGKRIYIPSISKPLESSSGNRTSQTRHKHLPEKKKKLSKKKGGRRCRRSYNTLNSQKSNIRSIVPINSSSSFLSGFLA